jgi:hypothetical protein
VLKITRLKPGSSSHSWKLEGRLVGPWVAELRQLAETELAGSGGLSLDVSDLSFADRGGEALLRELVSRRVRLERPSGFLRELLDGERGQI